jgi:calcium-activated chloride channel regulator 4
MKRQTVRYVRTILFIVGVIAFLSMGIFHQAEAGSHWFSKARQVQRSRPEKLGIMAAGDIGTTVFDLVISLYNDPTGDDNPNNDTGSEQQTNYEQIIRFWADAIYEQSNSALKLGKVRIYRHGFYGALADVVWNASEWPCANPSGFGVPGAHIYFGDVFGSTNFLNSANHEDGGYTLGHESGHYVFGLYDEYQGNVATHSAIYWPLSGDTPVVPSIMNSQWNATITGGGNDFRWLNHSTSNNYQANTAQGRCYGASGWDVLIREVGDDPKDGSHSTLPQRVRYTALVGHQPTAANNWMVLELPGGQNNARSELEIIWMQDDIEMQIVLDRSGSMSGNPLANAKQAGKTLVDSVENGHTALGVVSFDDVVTQSQPIVPIPDPPDTVKTNIKAVIDALSAGNMTAMFDAAKLALDNLITYATTSGTNASQLVFLLSDGLDNSSSETQATVTAAYKAADVPLNTFAYGGFAPNGVLRQLAEDTGGLFRATPTSLAEIQSAFLAAKAALTSSPAILQETITVLPHSSGSFPFSVDSTLKDLSIYANFAGGESDVSFSLAGPSSPVSFDCTEVAGTTCCSATALVAGATGEWALVATNNTDSPVNVNVDILANPLPVRTFDLVVSSMGGTNVIYPNPILITATISQGLHITGVNISANIKDPTGTVRSLELVDTGNDGDGIANDGTYSAIVDSTMNGIYTIQVMVNNEPQTARFTMEGAAPSADENGEMPPSPVFPPITENFTRSASTQVLVTGVVADDHPNTAPGTSITPNNSEVAGRIEVPGDVDFFTVPTAGFDSLTFRVTGLALGMVPQLTIYEEDGVTEIQTATLDQPADDAAYLAITVPVNGNALLHAKVSHASNGTGIYQVSVGHMIASDQVKWVAIEGGYLHTIALKSNGTLWAWGSNDSGQLGDGTNSNKNSPVQIGSDTTWSAIAAGYLHTIALKSNGTLWTWGYNSSGQLGDGTNSNKNSPVQIGSDTTWRAIAAGEWHTIALKSDGTLWAWGSNYFGQLGDGTNSNRNSPVQIGSDTRWVAIAAGDWHTIALKSNGTLWAWGRNSDGQLGDGTNSNRNSPVRIGTDTRWRAIAAGDLHTIALKSNGTLWAWGDNGYGQLGDGTNSDRNSPVRIGSDTTWTAIADGKWHTIALKSNGTLWAWGHNAFGQLGDGTNSNRNSPVQIGSDTTWVSIAGGYFHTIALKSNDTLWTWGWNSFGQLGDGTNISKKIPVPIS